MTGYGSGGWGDVPWGGPADDFDLLIADAISPSVVDLTFTAEVLIDSVATDPATYSIDNGLTVLSAAPGPYPNVIRLTTSPQVLGQFYTVTVSQTLQDTIARVLNLNVASFIGVGETVTAYVINSGSARTFCEGKSVNLAWTLPAGAQHVKVVRRTGAWPFDLTDTHDVVYDGPAISSFFDTGVVVPISTLTAPVVLGATSVNVASATGYAIGQKVKLETLTGERRSQVVTLTNVAGSTLTFAGQPLTFALPVGARTSIDSALLGQTYYYYLVLVSTSPTPTVYDITDASRLMALSIDVYDGKEFFSNTHLPSIYKERDRADAASGGGGGFLDKWLTIMGCWLNLMRGNANAMKLIADPDKAPFHVLGAQNRALGIEPEGEAYDFDIVRRPLTSLSYVYKRKGSCPGIVEAVRMFTKWEAICTEFGFNRCAEGVGLLGTWDGSSALDYGQSSTITVTILAADGSAKLTDSSKAWSADLFEDGTLRGWMGDIACVDTNTATELLLKAPAGLTTLAAPAAAGAGSVTLTSTAGIVPGLEFQITNTSLQAEIVVARLVNTGTGVVDLCQTLQFSHATGSKVSIQKSIVRSQYVGPPSTQVGNALQDTFSLFTDHQWKGYKLRDSAGTVFDITDNVGQFINLSGTPVSGTYQIAKAFTGATPQLRYLVTNGQHSFLFEPTLDLQLRGTIFDPTNPLYNGPGSAVLMGIYGPSDIGVFIQTSVTELEGRAVGATGVTFTLDPTQPAPTTNELAGMYLNPNQNQVAMFRIISNTPTTLTLEANVSSLVVPGQAYYVMTPRNKTRFQRLNDRLRKEFTDTDTTPRILFV